jgi:hypothetical protein
MLLTPELHFVMFAILNNVTNSLELGTTREATSYAAT